MTSSTNAELRTKELRQAFDGQEVFPDDWTKSVNVIRETDTRVLVSSGKKKIDMEI